MSYSIDEIQGIGPAIAKKLQAVGIQTAEDLLERASTPKGRKGLATETSLREDNIRDWANHADLMRIDGVGGQFSELLEASGVDTVKELATRNAENLAEKMKEVNTKKNLTNRVPSAETLEKFIKVAKKLKPVMEY